MSESFDDMMRRELGDEFGEASDMTAKVSDLLERYTLPPDGILHVMEQIMDLIRPLARLRIFANNCEHNGVVPAGFRRELEALIVRQLTLLSQSEQ
jgi:hypothetical protein